MRFILKKLEGNIYNLMRGVGYHFQNEDKEKGEMAFVRFIGSRDYPRFHLYLKISENSEFNLHLDQKRPIYKGAPAHSADYEGEVVEKEAKRIIGALGPV